MFSASFLISYAEGLSADDQAVLLADLEGLAAELSDVFIAGEVLDIGGLMNQGDIMLEIGFENQGAYEAAKATDAWAALKDLLLDAARVDHYEFAAYGDDGLLHLTDTTESKAHRLLFTHVRDGADPEILEHAYQMMPFMQDSIEGFNNSKISKVVESEGTQSWDYVFECDYADENVYQGPYLTHPVHVTYVDKFFEPIAKEYCFVPFLCTSVIASDGPFLANYADVE